MNLEKPWPHWNRGHGDSAQECAEPWDSNKNNANCNNLHVVSAHYTCASATFTLKMLCVPHWGTPQHGCLHFVRVYGVVCVFLKQNEKTMLSFVHLKFIFRLNNRQQFAPTDGACNFSNIFLGLSQNEPKVIQKRPQSYFQMTPKWSQIDPKNILQWPRIDPRWIWNDPNAILRWPKMI